MIGPRGISSLASTMASCGMITDKMGTVTNPRILAEPKVEGSSTVLEEEAISWGLFRGVTCILSDTVSAVGEETVPECPPSFAWVKGTSVARVVSVTTSSKWLPEAFLLQPPPW